MPYSKKNVKIAVIGSGFSGIATAAYLGKMGYEVHILEKNPTIGGRARQFTTKNGFTFDMGPSWYWMPDVIESFFEDFSTNTSLFFELTKLDPQFEIVFSDQKLAIPDDIEEQKMLFESMEANSGEKFSAFMQEAERKYQISMRDFILKPSKSWREFFSLKILKYASQLDLLSNFRAYTKRFFKSKHLQTIMEFPVIFLGASPKNIPAMYSLMNYGGYGLGTWYPQGGFYSLVKAMETVAKQQGVEFHTNKSIDKIEVKDGRASTIYSNGEQLKFDYIVSSADYHHTETLLEPEYRNYNDEYWKSRTFAPSCLLFYLGFDCKIPNLEHHTLFFENDLDEHIKTIYSDKKWPEKPLFYACCTSKTDNNVAPEGCENLFLLIPIATDLEESDEIKDHYLQDMLKRIEKKTGISNLNSHIIYKKSYCVQDFKNDYNAFGGNAYGLANTLKQTAVLKPKIYNKKIKNLFYTGQLTVPGPGVPPAILSGKIVANEVHHAIIKNL